MRYHDANFRVGRIAVSTHLEMVYRCQLANLEVVRAWLASSRLFYIFRNGRSTAVHAALP